MSRLFRRVRARVTLFAETSPKALLRLVLCVFDNCEDNVLALCFLTTLRTKYWW